MPNFEYNPNMYPFGMFTTGEGAHLAYIPELNAVYPKALPPEIVEFVAGILNMHVRAGMSIEDIAAKVEGKVERALKLHEFGGL